MPWYEYIPVDSFPHDPGHLPSYTNVGGSPPTCPSPNDYLCAVQASDNGGKPILTSALYQEMARALNNRVDTTNVKLRLNQI